MTIQNERDFRTVIIVSLAMAFAVALGLFSSAHAAIREPATWSNYWKKEAFILQHYVQYYRMQRWDKEQEKRKPKPINDRIVIPKPVYCDNLCG